MPVLRLGSSNGSVQFGSVAWYPVEMPVLRPSSINGVTHYTMTSLGRVEISIHGLAAAIGRNYPNRLMHYPTHSNCWYALFVMTP